VKREEWCECGRSGREEEEIQRTVRNVVAANQLEVIRSSSAVDLVNLRGAGKEKKRSEVRSATLGNETKGKDATHSNLPIPHIPALDSEILHPPQRQLSQVPVLHTTRDQRHRNIPLNSIHSRPRRNESHDSGDDVDESVGRVVLVFAGLPKFIETGSSDDEGWVELEPVGSVGRVFEVFLREGKKKRGVSG